MFFILLSGRRAPISSVISGGQAEFESDINCITVDIPFVVFHYSSTTTLPSPPQFAADHMQTHGHKPLPSTEGCGLKNNATSPSEARTHCSRPSPFQRDVGLLKRARRRSWGWRTPGGTQEVGGPLGVSGDTSHDICRGSFSP